MADDLLLGVDLGTTGVKTALYTAAGAVLAESAAATELRWSGPGQVDQDPDDFYRAATATMAACVARSGVARARVAALGITGQMAGVLGVDAEWRPSTPYDSWLDTRCAPDVDYLARELGDELVLRTGCPPMVDHAPKIRWWRRMRPDAFDRTAAFVMPGGYVAGKLAGLGAADAFIDHTYLHFTGLADARAAAWSPELAAAVGVPLSKLPRIVAPATIVGHLTAAAASDCGLRPGVPVAAGLGDTAAGALGAGIVRPRQLLDTAGTAAVFAASTDAFRPDQAHKTLIVMRGAVEAQWVSLAYLSGGSLLSWFREAVTGEGGAMGEEDFLRLTADLEGLPAGSDGLLFVPHLDGRILPNEPTMRGAWVGLHRGHRRGHLARAILEGVAYEYAVYLGVLLGLHPDLRPEEARAIGGGARSDTWNRIKASVLGVPYLRLDRDELACWGAALVAGHAVGLLPDLAAAATAATGVARRYAPVEGDRAVYRELGEQYRAVLQALAGPSKALSALQARAQQDEQQEERG